jgi:hypothetical protein
MTEKKVILENPNVNQNLLVDKFRKELFEWWYAECDNTGLDPEDEGCELLGIPKGYEIHVDGEITDEQYNKIIEILEKYKQAGMQAEADLEIGFAGTIFLPYKHKNGIIS